MRVTIGPPTMTGLYGPTSGVRIGRADAFIPHPLYPRLVSSRAATPATRRYVRSRPRQPETVLQQLPLGWPFSGVDPIAPGMGGAALGKKNADGLTKKERRQLKEEAAAAQQLALNSAISQVQQIIRDLMSGALSPDAQVTMPDVGFTPQGKKAKSLRKKYEKLVQKELPKAQIYAQKKLELRNIDIDPVVTAPPPPVPDDEDPSYTPPPSGGGGATPPPQIDPGGGFTVPPGYYDMTPPPVSAVTDDPTPPPQPPPTIIIEGDEGGAGLTTAGKMTLGLVAAAGIGGALWFVMKKKKKGRRR